MKRLLTLSTYIIYLLASNQSMAAELSFNAVIDLRLTYNETITSFRDGGYGKFDLNNNQALSLAQAGGSMDVAWDNGLSTHFVANAYQQNNDTKLGITEGYLKYLSLPNESGYRWQTKLGVYYPEISLENNAIAWASKNTLNSSAINTWVGEEIRLLGNEYTLVRLGKFNNSDYDLSMTIGAFINNDPSAALLAWHGWSIGNRQTLWTEKVKLPPLLALQPGNPLNGHQSTVSDPFLEVDDNLGWHTSIKITWHRQAKILLGYYNNQAKPYISEYGQYAWKTSFFHMGGEWILPENWLLTGQYLNGETLMQNHYRNNIVYNKYASSYLALSKRMKRHRYTLRLEEFSVTDKDAFAFDNNNEYGKSFTFNYTYRLSEPLFLSLEYNWINSKRPAREYANIQDKLIERQSQFSIRYFF